MRPPLLLLSMLLGAVAGLPAAADPEHDHNRAQRALERGEIRPLHALLAPVEQRFGARLLEVELRQERGRLVYGIKLITPDGRIFEVGVDAATGGMLPSDPGGGH
ncbi:PepSY domain-containing protein [Sinirhodobacter huangdaonensis]|uniref:PepSY domain-containing protein n=1 Tax=Paenirhodobacter huangdaonensis TaxID=2501515 RepID=A0A3S3PEI4_9RHOB|nr:PepSY domain-containing protein [Sinirhodobacter huangdaonensis]RWR52061.1 hypothetical protein EOW66_09835 [Sinirhodobacter huangdaonensis]